MYNKLQNVGENVTSFFQSLDILNIYLFSYSLAAILLLIRHLYRSFSNTILRSLKCIFFRFLALPILFNTAHFTRLTRYQAILLLIFIAVNILPLSIGDLSVPRRAAFMASLNLVPVFIGKRGHPFVALLGLSAPTYHLLHRWAGRMAVVDGTIHAILKLGQSESSRGLMISGYLVSVPLYWPAIADNGLRRQQAC